MDNEHTTCDICSRVIPPDMPCLAYARGRVHMHYGCQHKLLVLEWIQDFQDIDKYLSAISNTIAGAHNLTIKNFITDSDEHIAMIEDLNYYLFIDNEEAGPYICVCNEFFNTVPVIINGLNNHIEKIMAVFHRGAFFQVVTKITVALVDEYGRGIKLKED